MRPLTSLSNPSPKIRLTTQPQNNMSDPTTEKAIRKFETTIAREAKNEEKSVKHAVKDLSASEKEAQKAEKVRRT